MTTSTPSPGHTQCFPSRASSSESLSTKTCSLFLPNYVQDKYLLQLLRNADDVSTWVAAEIVTSHTSKVGASIAQNGGWVPHASRSNMPLVIMANPSPSAEDP
jgi:hypothetical protein